MFTTACTDPECKKCDTDPDVCDECKEGSYVEDDTCKRKKLLSTLYLLLQR